MNKFLYNLLIILLLISSVWSHQQLEPESESESRDEKRHVKLLLTERTWEKMLKGEWIVGFCVPLVPNCFEFERTWIKFALEMEKSQHEQRKISVASMELAYSETLVRRFSLNALPTVLHVKDGVFRQFEVSYTVKELKDLVLSNAWQKIRPLPFWRHPNGYIIHISILYIELIDRVYETQFLGIEYNQATWLVRICLMLTATTTVTIICIIYSLIRKLANWRRAFLSRPQGQSPTDGTKFPHMETPADVEHLEARD